MAPTSRYRGRRRAAAKAKSGAQERRRKKERALAEDSGGKKFEDLFEMCEPGVNPASRRAGQKVEKTANLDAIPAGPEYALEAPSAGETASGDAAAVTRAITVQSPCLAWAMLEGHKVVENRDWRIQPGWYALHCSKKKNSKWAGKALEIDPALKPETELLHFLGAVVGILHISEQRSVAECKGYKWALGVHCHVVDQAIKLQTPIPSKGDRKIWKMPQEVQEQIRAQEPLWERRKHNLTHFGAKAETDGGEQQSSSASHHNTQGAPKEPLSKRSRLE